MRTGYLDFCAQSHCAGWAAEDGKPAALELFLNESKIADLVCDIDRPDLAAAGYPRQAGFSHVFNRPLGLSDVIDVRFKGGSSLAGSPTTQHQERLRALLEGVTPHDRGLEVGPLDRPILGKVDYQVLYVDHATREDLTRKYVGSGTLATVRPEYIHEVDIVWNGRLLEVAGGNYGYCLASHVIEHVADPIGWLGEIAEVLRPGGRLNLAVPERTRGFDHLRSPSTPAAILEAYERKLRKPSFAQIFDHISGVSPLNGPIPDRHEAIKNAYQVAKLVEVSGQYVDVHCHVWTYASFLECWEVIDTLNLLPLTLAQSVAPFGKWNEFIVSFTRD